MKDRGRQLEQILHQYMTFVKPAFEEFCLPVSRHFSLLAIVVSRLSTHLIYWATLIAFAAASLCVA